MEYFGLDSKPNQDEIGLLYPTRKLLKTTYRQLILIHHPDKQGGDTEEFQRIDAAYKELLALYDDDKEGGKFKYLNESYNEEKLKSDGTSAQPTAGGDTAGTKKTSSSSSSGGGPYTDYVNSNNQNNTQGTNSTNKVPRASAAQSTPKSNKTNDNDADTNGNKPFDPFNTQYQSPPPPSDFDPFASPIPPHQQKFDPNKFKRKGPQQQNPNGPNSNDPFGSVNFWANQQSQTGQSGMQSGNNSSSSSTSYIPPNSPFHGIPEPQSPKPTTAPSGPTIKRKDSKQLHVVEVLLTGLRAVQKSGTYRVEVALDGRAQTQRRWTEFPEQAVQNTKLGCYFQPPEHLTFFRWESDSYLQVVLIRQNQFRMNKRVGEAFIQMSAILQKPYNGVLESWLSLEHKNKKVGEVRLTIELTGMENDDIFRPVKTSNGTTQGGPGLGTGHNHGPGPSNGTNGTTNSNIPTNRFRNFNNNNSSDNGNGNPSSPQASTNPFDRMRSSPGNPNPVQTPSSPPNTTNQQQNFNSFNRDRPLSAGSGLQPGQSVLGPAALHATTLSAQNVGFLSPQPQNRQQQQQVGFNNGNIMNQNHQNQNSNFDPQKFLQDMKNETARLQQLLQNQQQQNQQNLNQQNQINVRNPQVTNSMNTNTMLRPTQSYPGGNTNQHLVVQNNQQQQQQQQFNFLKQPQAQTQARFNPNIRINSPQSPFAGPPASATAPNANQNLSRSPFAPQQQSQQAQQTQSLTNPLVSVQQQQQQQQGYYQAKSFSNSPPQSHQAQNQMMARNSQAQRSPGESAMNSTTSQNRISVTPGPQQVTQPTIHANSNTIMSSSSSPQAQNPRPPTSPIPPNFTTTAARDRSVSSDSSGDAANRERQRHQEEMDRVAANMAAREARAQGR